MIRGAAEACLELKAEREARAAAAEADGVGKKSEPSSAARPGTVAPEVSASREPSSAAPPAEMSTSSRPDEGPTRGRGGRGRGRGTKRANVESPSAGPKAKAKR